MRDRNTGSEDSRAGQSSHQDPRVSCLFCIGVVFGLLFLLAMLATVVVLPSVLEYRSAISQTAAAPPGTPTMPATQPNASQHFEALARYVTLVITIATVGVAFFGYLLRKSIRELEEDLDRRYVREATAWGKEREELRTSYEELQKTLQKFSDLKIQVEKYQDFVSGLMIRAAEAETKVRSPRQSPSEVEQAIADLDTIDDLSAE